MRIHLLAPLTLLLACDTDEEISSLKSQISGLQTQIDAMADLQTQIDSLQAELETVATESSLTTLQSRVESSEYSIDQLTAADADFDSDLSALSAEVSDNESTLTSH
ncbi:MAG: putative nucleic acid-binding Zn-ribbon protein, partial [Myxococcota bacterium]